MQPNNPTDVAAFIWPSYTGDEPRAKIFWPDGDGEWQTVRAANRRRPGNSWPRRPSWGYLNEADPYVMRMQIDAAADHGVSAFIYDWYWYDRRPFLEQCLNSGYLGAPNNHRVKFYLMWANHDANVLWDVRNSHLLNQSELDTTVWSGQVDRPEFERIGERLITRYFHHPCYYTLDDEPVFMIYDVHNLVAGLGGVTGARAALDWLRAAAKDSGLPGLHLQLVAQGPARRRPGPRGFDAGIVGALGFNSVTNYQFVHLTDVSRPYDEVLRDVVSEWANYAEILDVPYFPHVSVGWDTSPRFPGETRQDVLRGNSPELVEKAFREAQSFIASRHDQPALMTVNSWNEWTETSYLQPDNINGYGYLEALRNVFGPQD